MNIIIIAWLFPIIFMIHDFEEIIFVKVWRKRYQQERKNSKMKNKPFDHFKSTASFSIGVEIIFATLSVITLLSVLFNCYYIWYGLYFAIICHFIFAHFRLSIEFKHYTPGFTTSVIFLPISIYLLYKATILLDYNLTEIALSCLVGIILSFIIFYTLTSIESKLEKQLLYYSSKC